MTNRSFFYVGNEWVKRCAPSAHRRIKQAVHGRQWPIPRLLMGHLVWAHPRVAALPVREKHVLKWIGVRLPRSGVFLDVGAHCGWMSLQAARVVGPRGTVVAFEPVLALTEILEYHKRVNGLRQLQIEARAVAEWDASSVALSVERPDLGPGSSLTRASADACFAHRTTVVEVQAVKLDNYCEMNGLRPDMVKIDVEGAELMVLAGARQTFKRCHPVLIIAVHPPWLGSGRRAQELFAMLDELGYRVQESRITPFDGHEFGDYLCV